MKAPKKENHLAMFNKMKNKKNHSISTVSIDRKISSNDFVNDDFNGNGSEDERQHKEKCASLKRCFGFFDFLDTSWKLFKEFSADTSIHGK